MYLVFESHLASGSLSSSTLCKDMATGSREKPVKFWTFPMVSKSIKTLKPATLPDLSLILTGSAGNDEMLRSERQTRVCWVHGSQCIFLRYKFSPKFWSNMGNFACSCKAPHKTTQTEHIKILYTLFPQLSKESKTRGSRSIKNNACLVQDIRQHSELLHWIVSVGLPLEEKSGLS